MTDKKVQLFIPCLIDQLYPEMGMASLKLLRHLGYEVLYNSAATCCGQPAFNAGDNAKAKNVAQSVVNNLSSEIPIVCPSGSCSAMLRNFYPDLFKGESCEQAACSLGRKVQEFCEFIVAQNKQDQLQGASSGKIGFHLSCHSARELRVKDQPIKLLQKIEGVEWILPEANLEVEPACCGFGGLFSVKFDQIAQSIVKSRMEMFVQRGAETIITNDPGCIMHFRRHAPVFGYKIKIQHVVEFLAESLHL